MSDHMVNLINDKRAQKSFLFRLQSQMLQFNSTEAHHPFRTDSIDDQFEKFNSIFGIEWMKNILD